MSSPLQQAQQARRARKRAAREANAERLRSYDTTRTPCILCGIARKRAAVFHRRARTRICAVCWRDLPRASKDSIRDIVRPPK